MQYQAPAPARFHRLAAACLTLCSAVAQAAAPTQAELDSIVLYGNTTIAQDSTSAWGIWESVEPTAAGNSLPRTDRFTATEVYRPLGQFSVSSNSTPVVQDQAAAICSGGGICGFGIFYDGHDYGGYMYTPVNSPSDLQARAQELVFQPVLPVHQPYALTAEVVAGPVREVVNPLPIGPSPIFGFPIPLFPGQELPPLMEQAEPRSNFPDALAVVSTPLAGGKLLQTGSKTMRHEGEGYYYLASGLKGENYSLYVDHWANDYFSDLDTDIQATWYRGNLSRYVSGESEDMPSQYFNQTVQGVAGVATSDADMSALRAGNVSATYVGFDGKSDHSYANVKLVVNFGNGSFTGSFNGGTDGNNVAKANTAQGTQLRGLVGFDVTTGVITGANFKSTGLAAADGVVKGSVTGAFFGPSAAAAGGVADITKTRTDGAYTDARFTSPFLTIKGLKEGAYSRNRD